MRYDLFLLQSASTPGGPLTRGLRQHPGLFLASRSDCEEKLAGGCEEEMLRDPRSYREGLVNGLVLGSSLHLRSDLPRRVAELCRDDALFVQVVRDPVEEVLLHLRQARLRALLSRHRGAEEPAPPAAEIYVRLRPRLRYFHQGGRYARHFRQWKIVDAAELLAGRRDATLRRLFSSLQLDPDRIPALPPLENVELLEPLLLASERRVEVEGLPLSLRLDFSDPNAGIGRPQLREVAHAPGIAKRVSFPAPDRAVALVVRERDWARLPMALRSALEQTSHFQELLEHDFLPRWIAEAEAVLAELAPGLPGQLEPQLSARVRRELGEEQQGLFGHRPDLANRWGQGSLLGASAPA